MSLYFNKDYTSMRDFLGQFRLLKVHLVFEFGGGGSLGIVGVKSLFPVAPSRPSLSHVPPRCQIFIASKDAY